jgi:hypothetical protein
MTTLVSLVGACSDDEIDSDEAARRAYLGLDASIGKSITLGFQGFNAASSANIDPQMTTGTAPNGSGTLTISGQVDQGSSSNKGMRLYVAMVDYSDGPFVIDDDGNTIEIFYDTAAEQTAQPFLSMMLKSIPTGTIEGTLVGDYLLSGALEGEITLNLTFNGQMQGTSQQDVTRVPGSTTVTGTATNSDGGVYNVNVTL